MQTIGLIIAGLSAVASIAVIACVMLRCPNCGHWHEEDQQCPPP